MDYVSLGRDHDQCDRCILTPRGWQFDHKYYQKPHAKVIRDKLSPRGLVKLEIDRVLADRNGVVLRSVAAAHLFFNDIVCFMTAMAAEGESLSTDWLNYTDIVPVVVVSEVIQ